MEVLDERRVCVVVNNQFEDCVVAGCKRVCEDPDCKVLFQPYTKVHLQQVSELLRALNGPVPVFFVAGNYSETVCAVGKLEQLDYMEKPEDLSPERRQELTKWTWDNEDVYALNLLTVTHLMRLRHLPLDSFVKRSDERPLKPGRWPASVCYAPPLDILLKHVGALDAWGRP